jgi:ATP synthase F1 delta subunit
VIDFQRGHELISIIKSFMHMYQEHYGIVFIKITSVLELSPTQKRELENAIKHCYKIKKITTRYIVDLDLIGGVKIQTNNFSIDASIKNRLNLMKRDSFVLSQRGE